MIIQEDNYLAHYGVLRKSGRYPWGSGKDQNTRNKTFLDMAEDLKRQGLTEKQIVEGMGLQSTTQLRALKSIAGNELKQDQIRMAQRLKDKGYSNVAIGKRMDLNESSVRAMLAPGQKDKLDVLQTTANMLKKQVDEKGLIDVGLGVEHHIGISPDKLATAVFMLREEGYGYHYIKVPQLGTGKFTTRKVLSKPNVPYSEVYKNRDQIRLISEHTDTGGRGWAGIRTPTNISSTQIQIVYAKDGGTEKDGVIELRPGAKDLDLGGSRYAQVRIAVDGTHYLKGMAVYNADLPAGVDVRFNTNKTDTGNKTDAMKPLKDDKENPFGSVIKPGGQRGALNIVNDEGDWDNWSRNLSSQVLSKQSPDLAKTQLNMTFEKKQRDLNEITALTNPAIKKKLLESFADDADSSAVHLKAAALPRQRSQVILPVKTLKDSEIYAPNFNNGERVALIRYPHAGTFEIPVVTVNNRNAEAKRLMGRPTDAVGINSKVAQRLSGADFDGDAVVVIPNDRGSIKTSPALEQLKGFDPQIYKRNPESGTQKIKDSRKQHEMGNVTNLISDMTIRGASNAELSRAVRHSMVVIDAEKHDLDYKASARDFGIAQLKAKYQGSPRGGATTLITRASAELRIPEVKPRRASDGGSIDVTTGQKKFVETGRTFERVNKNGVVEVVKNTTKTTQLGNTDDAFTLVSAPSGTPIERVYADHSNKLKALANQARKEAVLTKTTPYSKSAKTAYQPEVVSLNSKLNTALRNAPYERQAQSLANAVVAAKKQANPNMDAADLKKIKGQALKEARLRTGAAKQRINITPSEWNAIQSGAISNNKLEKILNNTDTDLVRKLATPKETVLMTSVKTNRAKAMLDSGYTQAEVAAAIGVSLTTLKTTIGGG